MQLLFVVLGLFFSLLSYSIGPKAGAFPTNLFLFFWLTQVSYTGGEVNDGCTLSRRGGCCGGGGGGGGGMSMNTDHGIELVGHTHL